jgi:hypothetical protein
VAGLSSLKVNIKDQPHNLAWINEEEGELLKALGGSGRAGPMGIPAYFLGYGAEQDYEDLAKDAAESAAKAKEAHLKEAAFAHHMDELAFHPDYEKAVGEADKDIEYGRSRRDPDNKFTDDQIAYMYDSRIAKEFDLDPSQVNTRGISTHDLEDLYDSEMIGWNELNNNPVYQQQKAAEDLAERQRDAKALQDKFAAQGIEATVAIDPEGGYHYGGPDAFEAAGGEMYDAAKFVATHPMTAFVGLPASGLATMAYQAAMAHPDVKAAYENLPDLVKSILSPTGIFEDKKEEEVPEEFRSGPVTELDPEQWAEMERDYVTAQEVEGTEGIVRPPQKTIVREEVPEKKVVFDPVMSKYFAGKKDTSQIPSILYTSLYSGSPISSFQQFIKDNNLENANPFVQRTAWLRENQVRPSEQTYPKVPGKNQSFLNTLYTRLA